MRRFHSHRVIAAFAAALVAVAAGCGGRYSDAERLAAAEPPAGRTPAAPSNGAGLQSGPGTVAGSSLAAQPAPSESAAMPESSPGGTAGDGPGTQPAGGAGATAAPGGGSAGPTAGKPSVSTDPGANGAGGGPPGPGPAAPARTGGPAPAPAVPSAPKSPIKLGVIGVRSGVVGAIFVPIYEGAVAWAGDVNRRGGLAGHPVQLVAVDDGNDPRKAVALAKRLVETDKVTAIYAAHMLSTFDTILPYLEEKGIPAIGSSMSNVGHERSPIFFNTSVSSRLGLMWDHFLPLVIHHPDIKDIGVMYCAEAEVCRVMNSVLQEVAPQHGYRIRYTAQVSVAQPDYTAEVVAARSAGAKAIVLPLDNNSAVRIAASAHRQGYHPVFAIQGTGHTEKLLRDGGSDVEGFVVGGLGRHWTSPLLAEFRAAYKAHVPNGQGFSGSAILSWNSGKLLERVAPTWPAEPTPADVIASLRTLSGETLGGLIPPRSFRPGDLAGTVCASVYRIDNGEFVPYQGRDDFHCPPGYQPG